MCRKPKLSLRNTVQLIQLPGCFPYCHATGTVLQTTMVCSLLYSTMLCSSVMHNEWWHTTQCYRQKLFGIQKYKRTYTASNPTVSEWVCRLLTAHQHIKAIQCHTMVKSKTKCKWILLIDKKIWRKYRDVTGIEYAVDTDCRHLKFGFPHFTITLRQSVSNSIVLYAAPVSWHEWSNVWT